ncbi:MAG: RNA-binding S4 domain-containing protein [Magnetospirillum sp.]|nr:MAG: RNA-binding S4 domain-containing protein [Magnetospirillum sp.]
MGGSSAPAGLRVDRWLFFARFFKSRALATRVIEGGEVRLNGRVVAKPAQPVAPGDELIFPTAPKWRHVRVLALAEARRPAPEARLLYEDIIPSGPSRLSDSSG